MLCTLTRPGETVELFRGWAAWLILDYIIGVFIGPGPQARALAAIVGLYILALLTGSCSKEEKDSKEKDNKEEGHHLFA